VRNNSGRRCSWGFAKKTSINGSVQSVILYSICLSPQHLRRLYRTRAVDCTGHTFSSIADKARLLLSSRYLFRCCVFIREWQITRVSAFIWRLKVGVEMGIICVRLSLWVYWNFRDFFFVVCFCRFTVFWSSYPAAPSFIFSLSRPAEFPAFAYSLLTFSAKAKHLSHDVILQILKEEALNAETMGKYRFFDGAYFVFCFFLYSTATNYYHHCRIIWRSSFPFSCFKWIGIVAFK